jgi:hypothetical protein
MTTRKPPLGESDNTLAAHLYCDMGTLPYSGPKMTHTFPVGRPKGTEN